MSAVPRKVPGQARGPRAAAVPSSRARRHGRRLALVTMLQFAENFTDRTVVHGVRYGMALKHALAQGRELG